MNTEKKTSATRIVASTFGVLVGLAGIDHGIFEILQGNLTPSDVMIAAIGPAQRFWEHGRETALTIVPNFLLTGILVVIVGCLMILWSIAFVHRKPGAVMLLFLSIVQFLVGGGFAPIFLAILAVFAATQIDQLLHWFRKLVPSRARTLLAKLWLGVLIALVVLFLLSVEIAIFGLPLTMFFDANTALNHLWTLADIMLGLMVLAVLTGFAHDSQQQVARG